MGMDPRAMAAAMKRMGVEMRDIPGVEEVVVRTADKEYHFRRAQVSVMKAQGQETWSIVGKPEVVERAGGTAGAASPATPPATSPGPTRPAMTEADNTPRYVPTDEDVRTVADAAKVSPAVARKALLETNGDLAEAILKLS